MFGVTRISGDLATCSCFLAFAFQKISQNPFGGPKKHLSNLPKKSSDTKNMLFRPATEVHLPVVQAVSTSYPEGTKKPQFAYVLLSLLTSLSSLIFGIEVCLYLLLLYRSGLMASCCEGRHGHLICWVLPPAFPYPLTLRSRSLCCSCTLPAVITAPPSHLPSAPALLPPYLPVHTKFFLAQPSPPLHCSHSPLKLTARIITH